jgi:hypothetical protein
MSIDSSPLVFVGWLARDGKGEINNDLNIHLLVFVILCKIVVEV